MVYKYRFIRRSVGGVTIGRGLVYLAAPVWESLDRVHKVLYEAPSYKYMQYLPEWVWGILFTLIGVGMFVRIPQIWGGRLATYRVSALCGIILWVFTGTCNLLAFPLGANWLYAYSFSFYCLITLLRPDEDVFNITRNV